MQDGRSRLRWALVTLAAIAGVAVTARLGLWQLDRAAQKTALQRAGEERRALPPLAEAQTARDAAEAPAQHGRLASLEGRWLADRTVYLDNRQMDGRPGFFVVTPLLLDGGDAVAVQRGWLPRDFQDRTRVTPPATPAGRVRVSGRIAPPPARLYDFGEVPTNAIRQNLDLASWGAEIGLVLRPWSLVQDVPELVVDAPQAAASAGAAPIPAPQARAGSAPAGPVSAAASAATAAASAAALARRWPVPAADVSKHHGYAFQWFALSALIFGLYVWFQLIRPWRRPR